LSASSAFRKGEDITCIGNPGMGDDEVLENAISRGVMSTKTNIEGLPFYQLNIAINPGNSGGPVFDSYGRVIGVATLKSAKQEGMAFCIPVDDLNAAIARVNAKPGTPVDGAPSRHKALAAFKRLASGGAVLAVGLDVHRVAMQVPGGGLQIGEKRMSIADFDKALADLDSKAFGPAADAARSMKNDTGIAPSKREDLGKLAANYVAMRSMIGQARGDANAYSNRARGLKENHARLVEDLGKSLDAEVPPGLLATLRSENVSNPGTALAGLGSRSTGGSRSPFAGPRPPSSPLRDDAQRRMQEARDRADQRRQQLKDRMRGRR
jgi:serine protease Do